MQCKNGNKKWLYKNGYFLVNKDSFLPLWHSPLFQVYQVSLLSSSLLISVSLLTTATMKETQYFFFAFVPLWLQDSNYSVSTSPKHDLQLCFFFCPVKFKRLSNSFLILTKFSTIGYAYVHRWYNSCAWHISDPCKKTTNAGHKTGLICNL